MSLITRAVISIAGVPLGYFSTLSGRTSALIAVG
jgi:hypothetical protein